jgi:SAM-dependent methyltransferase
VSSRARAAARTVPALRRALLLSRFGDVGRTTSLTSWGTGRGTPVDRWYVERYLQRHSAHIAGRVLEVKSDMYASRLGAATVDIVDIDGANAAATIVGDLCSPGTLSPATYQAAIITQTLNLVDDPSAAMRNIIRSLAPGGVLLMTVPALSRLVCERDRWRWVPRGFAELVDSVAPPTSDVEVMGMGNGLAARAFLFGLAAEDLVPTSLAVNDPNYPVIVGGRIVIRA